jgi:ElaB/YqjD/DUF883 family membrane-anchored ribosome-binding protein
MNDVSAQAGATVDEVKNEFDRGQSKLGQAADAAKDDLSQELRKMRDEMSTMQKIITGFASNAGSDAKRMAQNIGATVASQVGDIAGDVASGARDQAKTFAAELEGMARRSPLSTIGGALLIGVVIGLVSRGRG